MLPFSHTVSPHQQDSNVMIVGYNGKSCKMQTVLEGSTKSTGKKKTRTLEDTESSGSYLHLQQTLVHVWLSKKKKNADYAKKQEKQSEETKHKSESNLYMTQMLELSKFKITMINKVKP